MKNACIVLWLMAGFLGALAASARADEAKDEAIARDRRQIAGTWRIVALEINGNKSNESDARKLSVVNGPDSSWVLHSEGQEVSRGTNVFDPTQKPKTIDFTVTEGGGKGNTHLGIYELGENTRRLCFAPPGKNRPSDFSAAAGSEHILVTFEREPAK